MAETDGKSPRVWTTPADATESAEHMQANQFPLYFVVTVPFIQSRVVLLCDPVTLELSGDKQYGPLCPLSLDSHLQPTA